LTQYIIRKNQLSLPPFIVPWRVTLMETNVSMHQFNSLDFSAFKRQNG